MLAVFVASAFFLQAPAAVDTMVDVGGYRVHCRIHRGTVPVTILMNTFDTLLNTARVAEPKIRAPMVVITSSRSMWNNRVREDRAWRASHEAIAAAAPKRRLVVAENSGHQVALDRPDIVIDAIVSLMPNAR